MDPEVNRRFYTPQYSDEVILKVDPLKSMINFGPIHCRSPAKRESFPHGNLFVLRELTSKQGLFEYIGLLLNNQTWS